MSVDGGTWADARLAKGTVGVQAQRLLDDGGKPGQMGELLVLNVVVVLEPAPDLGGKLLELVGVLGEEQDGGPEQLRVGIQAADEDVVDLGQEPVWVRIGNGPALLGERGEIVALLELLCLDHAVAHDALVLAKEPNHARRQHEVDERVEEREALEGLVEGDPEDDVVEPSEGVGVLLVLDVLVVVAVAQGSGQVAGDPVAPLLISGSVAVGWLSLFLDEKSTHLSHVKAVRPATFGCHLVNGSVDYFVQDGILLLEGAGTESRSHPLADDSVLLRIGLGGDSGMGS